MSVSAQINDEGQSELATTRGWGEFCMWLHKEEENDNANSIHLIEHGWTDGIDLLKEELHSYDPPPAVVEIRDGLLSMIEDAAEDDVLSVTTGLGPDNDDTKRSAVAAALESVRTTEEARAVLMEAYP